MNRLLRVAVALASAATCALSFPTASTAATPASPAPAAVTVVASATPAQAATFMLPATVNWSTGYLYGYSSSLSTCKDKQWADYLKVKNSTSYTTYAIYLSGCYWKNGYYRYWGHFCKAPGYCADIYSKPAGY